MYHRHFSSVCVAIVFAVFTSLSIAVPKAFSQADAAQDPCDQWVKSHAAEDMQMNMNEGDERMFMLSPGDPLPVVCLVRNDPFQPPEYEGIGNATRKVPGNPKVQTYFNQGLQFYYAFNNRESYRAARCAASIASKGTPPCAVSTLTPACAMCYVVEALALGPDINRPRENELDRKAALQVLADADKALETDFSGGGIPKKEHDEIGVIIAALKLRFENCPTGGDCQDWRNDRYQKAIAAQLDQYKDDPDYVILFADAVMNRIPWGYWNADGSPKFPEVKQAQEVIEAALKKNPPGKPQHNGLIHWYIHLMEMSGQPNLAEPYARQLAGLAPNAGHLVHMPAHIYYRLGDMQSSIETNATAIKKDRNYFCLDPTPPCKERLKHPDGDRYRFGYYPHNIHFELASAALLGQRKTVEGAAKDLLDAAPVSPIAYRADRYRAVYYLARLNFASRDQIKQFPQPGPDQLFAAVAYYYAQLVADIVPFDTGAAQKDYAQLDQYAQKYRDKAKAQGEKNADCDPPSPSRKLPGDISLCVIRIMSRLGLARISAGDFQDPENILKLTDDAARTQKALPYDEPPAWLYPVDQTFAGLMLSRYVSKRPQRRSYLELAMKRLEDSLQEKQPLPSGVFLRNAWAYFGLWQIAEKLGLQDKAQKYKAIYNGLWQGGPDPQYLQM